MPSTVQSNGSITSAVVSEMITSPELQKYIDLLGEFNLPNSSKEFTNLGFAEFVNNEGLMNSFIKLIEKMGFSAKSARPAAKFFFAALRSNSAAKSLLLLEQSREAIHGLAKAMGR